MIRMRFETSSLVVPCWSQNFLHVSRRVSTAKAADTTASNRDQRLDTIMMQQPRDATGARSKRVLHIPDWILKL